MGDIHIGIVGPSRAGKATLAQAIAARSKELFQQFQEEDEAQIWDVKCVITGVHPKDEKKLVDKDDYHIPIVKLGCEVGKPFKIFWERGGFMTHQVVMKPPEEDDYGFWIETTTKMWRFDYI